MLFVDTSMVIHRALHKLDFLKNSKGVHTGMEFGTFKILESLEKKFPNEIIILCFDKGISKRKKIDPNYKANRSKRSDEFIERSERLQEVLSVLYRTAYAYGEEADELIYSLANQYTGPHYIYSNDDDLLQAVNDEYEIQVVKSFQSKLYYWDEAKIREKYYVGPALLPMFRAFIGDSSDNIKGIPRINRKLLAEALTHALDKWSGESIFDFLEIFMTENLFSDNMKLKVRHFVEDGNFLTNYRLIKLMSIPTTVNKPEGELQIVENFLKEKEIYSLGICEKLGMKNIQDGDEF